MSKIKLFLFSVFIFLLAASWIMPILEAQSIDREGAIKKINEYKADIKNDLSVLQKMKNYSLAMIISIGVLGALIALLSAVCALKNENTNKIKKKKLKKQKNGIWLQLAIPILGFLITVLTIFSDRAMKGDYRFWQKRISQGIHMYNDYFEGTCSKDRLNEMDINQLIDTYHKAWDEYDKIEDVIDYDRITYEQSADATLGPFAGSILFAQPRPEWLTKPPETKNTLFFLGFSSDANLNESLRKAHSDAIEKVSLYFLKKMIEIRNSMQGDLLVQQEIYGFSKFVRQVVSISRIKDTYTEFNNQDKKFYCYELVNCEKKKIGDLIDVFFKDYHKTYKFIINKIYMFKNISYDGVCTKTAVYMNLSKLLGNFYPLKNTRDKVVEGILLFIKFDLSNASRIFARLAIDHPGDEFINNYNNELNANNRGQ